MVFAIVALSVICLWLIWQNIITRKAHNELYDMFIKHTKHHNRNKHRDIDEVFAESLEKASLTLDEAIKKLRGDHEK